MAIITRSDFYIPRSNIEWILFDTDNPSLPDEETKIYQTQNEHLWGSTGLWDHSNMNSNMKELLHNLNIDEDSTETLLQTLRMETGIKSFPSIAKFESQNETPGDFQTNLEKAAHIVYEWEVLKKNVFVVGRKYDEDPANVRKILKLFRMKQTFIKKHNRRFLNKKRKVNLEIIELVNEYWQEHKYINFTLDDLRYYLNNKKGDDWNISNSTLARLLKRDIRMSYKKVNRVHPSIALHENKRKMLEAVALQIKLVQNEVTVIYIDEFKYSWHQNNYYGWTVQGKSGYRKLNISKFQASFIVAFSQSKIHGIMSTSKTYNSSKFRYFIYKLVNTLKEDYALVCDNSKVHVSKLMQWFLEEYKLWLITIPSYSPFVNPCEKLILNIKSRIRKVGRSGKEITLKTFKNWIDSIKPDELRKWVLKSFIDTQHLWS